ncbi:MAG: hypothetical protein ACRDT6_19535 [Micromonosporaceae bacterium]
MRRVSAVDGGSFAMSVTALFTDVVLDDAAVRAQRLALLAELTAEQFSLAYVGAADRGHASEVAAVRHLELAAGLARRVADRERVRCASAMDDRVADRVPSDPSERSA